MRELLPKEAAAYLDREPQALLIDCRSTIEYAFVGPPPKAVHIPWNDAPDWDINPHFVADVRKLCGNVLTRPVLLLCRSGHRSALAGQALEAAGFSEVINIQHGFEGDLDSCRHRNTLNGWRVDGLPWEQS